MPDLQELLSQLLGGAPASMSNIDRSITRAEWDANDEGLRRSMGHRYRWNGEPLRGRVSGTGALSSPLVSSQFGDNNNAQDIIWEEPPDAGLMYRYPTQPEMWTKGSKDLTSLFGEAQMGGTNMKRRLEMLARQAERGDDSARKTLEALARGGRR